MNVVFIPICHLKKSTTCSDCDHGRAKLPLIEYKDYEVVSVDEEGNYELMGWGSMKFNPKCFVEVKDSPLLSDTDQ